MDVQLKAFEQLIMTNPIVASLVERMPSLRLADCWLVSGCLSQTVWNALSDRDPHAGIADYDINYFDAADLSWDAEDQAIRRTTEVYSDVDAAIEVRNEARVHLWYERKFGISCPPFRSTSQAISTFPSCSSCLGVRPKNGGLEVFAPYGFSDLFAMTTRPNPLLAEAAIYETKTHRWLQQWPELTVLPWAPQ